MMLDQAPRFHARLHPMEGERGVSVEPRCFFSRRDSHLAASAESSVVLVTGPQIPQFYNKGLVGFYFRSQLMLEDLT